MRIDGVTAANIGCRALLDYNAFHIKKMVHGDRTRQWRKHWIRSIAEGGPVTQKGGAQSLIPRRRPDLPMRKQSETFSTASKTLGSEPVQRNRVTWEMLVLVK
jgi:hypothetical protein